jgi:hypothetical protein
MSASQPDGVYCVTCFLPTNHVTSAGWLSLSFPQIWLELIQIVGASSKS